MVAPAPADCSKTDCHWTTPAGIPTWDLVLKALEIHTNTQHAPAPAVIPPPKSAAKLEKLPRPTFTLQMTQAQWEFLILKWASYISQTPVSTEQKLHQLRTACDTDLLQRVYDAGNYQSLNTAELLLAAMKKLAVQVVHKTIHMMNMWKMNQDSGETIRAFEARITGTADLCNMVVQCIEGACTASIPYRDPVVMQVLPKGMHDKDIRARVLTRTTTNELTTMQEVVNYVAAEEAGLTQSDTLP